MTLFAAGAALLATTGFFTVLLFALVFVFAGALFFAGLDLAPALFLTLFTTDFDFDFFFFICLLSVRRLAKPILLTSVGVGYSTRAVDRVNRC